MGHDSQLKTYIECLVNPGAIIAGKITRLMGTCGNLKCKCMDKKNPQKHPYMQLSYSHEGKTKTMSVKKTNLDALQKMTENYKKLRHASLALGHEAAVLVKKHGVKRAQEIIFEAYDSAIRKKAGTKPASRILKKAYVVYVLGSYIQNIRMFLTPIQIFNRFVWEFLGLDLRLNNMKLTFIANLITLFSDYIGAFGSL